MTDERVLSDEERLQYTETANRQMLEFDSRLLWFSGGGLLGVLTFAGAADAPPRAFAIAALSIGGLCLLASSALTLYTFQQSALDIARFLEVPTMKFREAQMRRMSRMNFASLAFLVLGLVLLGVFGVETLVSK